MWVDDDDIVGDGMDILGCDIFIMVDYIDKMVLVCWGGCFFSDKVYYV